MGWFEMYRAGDQVGRPGEGSHPNQGWWYLERAGGEIPARRWLTHRSAGGRRCRDVGAWLVVRSVVAGSSPGIAEDLVSLGDFLEPPGGVGIVGMGVGVDALG